MKIGELLYFTNRRDWRSWLEKNHDKKTEVWLLYYKKNTGKPTIPYDDAVEEALCFGWIDGTVKRIDETKHGQRYTPRRKHSVLSQLNKKRADKMVKLGLMTKFGLDALKTAKLDTLTTVDTEDLPKDLTTALKKGGALKDFKLLPNSQKKMHLFSLLTAKKKETREKRIEKIIDYAKNNKRIY